MFYHSTARYKDDVLGITLSHKLGVEAIFSLNLEYSVNRSCFEASARV